MPALLLPNEILSMTTQAARLLINSGDGDGALLYLALMECGGDEAKTVTRLHWPETRLRSAWDRLASLGLARPLENAPAPPPKQDDRLPEYTRDELTAAQEREPEFAGLRLELEGMLGRILTDNDLKYLYTIYDYLSFPPEVAVLLTGWVIRRERRTKNNPAFSPRMYTIQQEAFRWKRWGIDTLEQAEDYLRRQEGVDQREWAILRAVGVTERRPAVEKEREFIAAWVDMGLSDELIRIAYERTVYRKKAMNWPYMNKILQSWHKAGYKTPAQVEAGDKRPQAPNQPQNFQPSQERIQKSNDKLDKFWAKQKKDEE